MTTQKAIVVQEPKKAAIVDRPIPKLRDDYVLVKVKAVALNPTDWKHIDYLAPPGALSGCDYAGIVEEVGKDVKKPFKKGDRICGFVHGGNAVQHEDGTFAEYIVVKGDIQVVIPDTLSFEEAATLGVGISTVGQALYQALKMAWPTEPLKKPEPILIYGGSTATGTLAIQFAKISGYEVYTTCSPRNFDLVKSLGADKVYDYSDPNSASQIRKDSNNKLALALDTIAEHGSNKFCDEALSTEGGDYSSLLSISIDRPNIKNHVTLAYTIVGEYFSFGPREFPANPEDKAFAEKWWELAIKFLGEGKVKVHPMKVHNTGLEGVLDGLEQMRQGKVSGVKLVYTL